MLRASDETGHSLGISYERVLRLKNSIIRTLLFFSMLCMGLITLATGIMLMSQGLPPQGLASGTPAFSGQGRVGFADLHPAAALITVALVVAHLLGCRRAVYGYARTAIPS